MGKTIRNLRHNTNAQILDAIHREASGEYQRRIPLATQAGIQATLNALNEFRTLRNEAIDALVNRIGTMIVRNISWQNPLAEFKQGLLPYGQTIEEVAIGLVKARTYNHDRDYMERELFGREKPDVQSIFHTVNRQDMYKITIEDADLTRAFLEQGGLSDFISRLMAAPATSDQWDEFLLTTSLFKAYEAMGGFYHVNVPNVSDLNSGGADARMALRKMRAMADTLKFLSTRYNAAHMPTFANAEDLCLFVTPEFNAAIDVEALAGAFNVDKADMHGRVIPIPEQHFNIDGCQAIMTTRDFFVIADNRLENTSQNNPAGLYNNYWLHHWQVVSASRFVPAVMFWTGKDDASAIEITAPTKVEVSVKDIHGADATEVTRGYIYALCADVTPKDADTTAVVWTLDGATSSRTWVDQTGVLHVGGDENATSLTVKATTAWRDSDNLAPGTGTPYTPASDFVTVTVVGEKFPEWPVEHGHDNVKDNTLTPDIVVNLATETDASVNHTDEEFNDDNPGGIDNDTTTVDVK